MNAPAQTAERGIAVRSIPLEDFHAALTAQGVDHRMDLAFICPMCGTVQSGRDFIAAGAGETFDEIERHLGFSCVGRWTEADAPRKVPDGNPCNWTLGGLFKLHRLEVITADGQHHPSFEPATPEQAQAHAAQPKGGAA